MQPHRHRGLGHVALAAISLYLLYYVFLSRSEPPSATESYLARPNANFDSCPENFLAEDVVVGVKTGATVGAELALAQARTSLRCAKNVIYFSDLEQEIEGIHFHDALKSIHPTVMENNPDFDFYHQQKDLWQTQHNVTAMMRAKHPTKEGQLAAWELDKYKNVHMVEETWAMVPDKKWYIFIDADTYVLWSSLLLWLSKLDPSRKTYAGSEVNQEGQRFAHGGSGYVLSHATMYEYTVTHKGTAAIFDPRIRNYCCGDLVLGMALEEQGNDVQEVWPLITGESQWTMPFGPEYWCHPQFTLHHMGISEMKSLSEFEEKRADQSVRDLPLLHSFPCPRTYTYTGATHSS